MKWVRDSSVTAGGRTVRLGRRAVLAEYPAPPRKSRLSLFEQAERVGGQDASGWALYRTVREDAQDHARSAEGASRFEFLTASR